MYSARSSEGARRERQRSGRERTESVTEREGDRVRVRRELADVQEGERKGDGERSRGKSVERERAGKWISSPNARP